MLLRQGFSGEVGVSVVRALLGVWKGGVGTMLPACSYLDVENNFQPLAKHNQ